MQAWALQQALVRMGHEPVTIDRQPDTKTVRYRATRFAYRATMKAFGRIQGPIQPERYLPQITVNTREFIRRNIVTSPPLDSTEKLEQHFLSDSYDAVIVGSDQTWRPSYSPNIYNFFLDFLLKKNIKKIAYATSFGVDHWEFTKEQTKICSSLAKVFDFIGVRELSGIKLCEKYLGIQADLVVDPTLLLTETDYVKLLGMQNNTQPEAGLYTYFLDNTNEKQNLAEKLSVQLNIPLFKHQAACSLKNYDFGPIEKCIIPRVEDWLSGFQRAKFVLTDSFHGMIFSIIFDKPFLIIRNEDRGSTRFHSLLSQLGLSNRLVENPFQAVDGLLNTTAQKLQVQKIKNLNALSYLFLEKALNK